MEGKKTGGRKKGTPNKATQFTKEMITELLATYRDSGRLDEDFDNIADPKDRLNIVVKLMQFVMPTMKAATLDVDVDSSQITLAEKLKSLTKREK